jgi:hypothetical protein
MKSRALLTIIALVFWSVINWFLNTAAPLVSGPMATKQFDNSDQSYLVAKTGMALFTGSGLPIIVLLAVLVAIWYKPVKKALLPALVLGALVLSSHASYAFFNTKDYPEYVEILPNQSAFLVPEVGANKDSQAQFGSQQYYQDNKVASKRIQIPHTLLKNPGWSYDYYIPSARLIIVDRTPYQREWTASATTGTSSKDESFHFESADSINISTDIVIAANVQEADAAKFLYWFGTKPPTVESQEKFPNDDPTDSRYLTFASIMYGHSLAEVMDTVVRGKVQQVLAREFGKRSTDDDIKQKAEIMDIVGKEVTAEFAAKGITIEYVGYANSLTFDKPVQEAINNAYMAEKNAQASQTVAPQLANMQTLAEIDLLKGVATKWNGQLPQLPSFVVMPNNMSSILSDFIGDKKPELPVKK